MPPPPATPPLTVLYDRDCSFCAWTALWLRRLDRARRLRFVPLQLATGDQADPHLAAAVAGRALRAELHVVDARGGVSAGGDAALAVGLVLPLRRLVRPFARTRHGRRLAALAYDWVADHRDPLARLVRADREAACRALE
jgi:predicted DCC family thiol-disulfide oxidoreductase YuxK